MKILTIHDIGTYNRLTGIKRFLYKILWISLPIKRTQIVTVVSEATKRDLIRVLGYDPGNIYLIPNFVRPEFKFAPKAFYEENPIILMVGTAPNKNIVCMAQALVGINCQIRIIGEVSNALSRFLNSLNLDWSSASQVADSILPTEFSSADLLLFCSLSEGFGIPIIEAQAVGRVVVTSNIPPMTEVAGKGALYAAPHDAASICNSVKQVIENPGLRNQLIQNGLANIEKFTIEKVIKSYLEMYQTLFQLNR